jgi:hypothetical protein
MLVHPRIFLTCVEGQAGVFLELPFCNRAIWRTLENDHERELVAGRSNCEGAGCPLCVAGQLNDMNSFLALLCKCSCAVIQKPERGPVHVQDVLLTMVRDG